MKRLLLAILLHTAILLSAQQTITTIYFENDVYALTTQGKQTIRELGISIQQKEIKSILLFGYADSSADNEYNIALSENRIKSVLTSLNSTLPDNYLQSKNIQPVLKWFGEEIPGEMRKKLNYGEKCVDVIVNYKQEEIVKKNSIKDLYAKLKPSPQIFCVNHDRDTILRAKNGTLVCIKANSFDLSAVNLKIACLKFKLIEGYSNGDMLMNNLTTVGHDKQLETGGMLYVEAEVNGIIVPLKKDADIVYMLPASEPKNDMQLFLANTDASGAMTWNTNGQRIDYFNAEVYLKRSSIWEERSYCNFWCRTANLFRSDDIEGNRWHSIWKGYKYEYPIEMDSLMKKYRVTNYASLQRILKKERMKWIESNINSALTDDWNYYVFNSTNLGWMNCDRFYETPERLLTNVELNLKMEEGTDAKLVFRSFKSVMSPNNNTTDKYTFSRVKIGEPVWVYAVKYENDKIYMCLQKATIEEGMTFQPEFKEYTLQELKKALLWMNT
ncbi:MAG: hypothetical protein H7Y00_05510 [Fimbriimonadaceae bacterium]|nr:hypothetical protein [Chitinophagales bacterium]